jgi:predicted CoA-binding protein
MGDPPMDLNTALPPIVFDGAGSVACYLPAQGPAIPDEVLLDVYGRARTVAMVGASPTWNRPSYFVMRYLQRKGFRVIPVNPRALDAPILGERVYPDLASIPEPIDIVDVFRRPEEAPAIARDAIAIGARVLWLQLGIRSPEAKAIATDAGLTFVEDHCLKIEYGRLSGELAWSGINTRILSSRRGRALR